MDQPNTHVHILVVDDSEIVIRFAQRVLKELDMPIETALDGRQALEAFQARPAEVLVTDLMMPVMDGFELIRQVRGRTDLPQPHIIVMTALDQSEDKVRALSLGANDYTVKPLDAGEFRARVMAGAREMRLKKQLTAALASLDREMTLVAGLQRRLLPKTLPQGEAFRAAVSYQPCNRAGGDYYDCFLDGAGRLVITVADVSGHGASAAVLMAMFRALLKAFIADAPGASELVGRLNAALLDNIGADPDFVSAFVGLVDPKSLHLNFCAAGHGDMMLWGPEKGRLKRLEAGGTVLGCFPGAWEEEVVALQPGQNLILYTDGLVEAVNENDEEFSRSRLEALLKDLDPGLPPEEAVSAIRDQVARFTRGTPFGDDVTLLVVQFQAPPGP